MINLSDATLYVHSGRSPYLMYADCGINHDASVSLMADCGFYTPSLDISFLSEIPLKSIDISGGAIVHYAGIYNHDEAYGVCTSRDGDGFIHHPFHRMGLLKLNYFGEIKSKSHSYIVPYKETDFIDALCHDTIIDIDPYDMPFGIFWRNGWNISFDNVEDLMKYRLSK